MKQPPKKPPVKPRAPPAKVPTPRARTRAAAKKPASKTKLVVDDITDDDIPSHPPEVVDDEVLIDDEVLVNDEPIVDDVPAKPASPPGTPKEPIDKAKLLGFIESIIGTLTFKTVGLVALLTMAGLLIFALYENRGEIVDKITQPKSNVMETPQISSDWVLSENSKQSLIGLAKATAVGIVLVTDVDLKKNRRNVRYYYLDDPTIVLSPTALQALALPVPVFDYDPKNTEQMVAILSNDFRCDPYKDTTYNRFAPDLAEVFPTVCRLAVPPFVGQFAGFIAVGIRGDVAFNDLETIRLEVSRIAVEIYLNDVTKKTAQPKK